MPRKSPTWTAFERQSCKDRGGISLGVLLPVGWGLQTIFHMTRLRTAGLSQTYRRNLRSAGVWLLGQVASLGRHLHRDDPPNLVDKWLERGVDEAYQQGERLYWVTLGAAADASLPLRTLVLVAVIVCLPKVVTTIMRLLVRAVWAIIARVIAELGREVHGMTLQLSMATAAVETSLIDFVDDMLGNSRTPRRGIHGKLSQACSTAQFPMLPSHPGLFFIVFFYLLTCFFAPVHWEGLAKRRLVVERFVACCHHQLAVFGPLSWMHEDLISKTLDWSSAY